MYRELAVGSSPHMRGTPSRTRCEGRQSGIIPAYAGNTDKMHKALSGKGDHPRICGEHFWLMALSVPLPGSSPHMRGTPLGLGYELARQWIIPAYAGNTRLHHASAQAVRDHPRICGEHDAAADAWVKAAGSSPHMRGTLPSFYHVHDLAGIIPAYAGNTWIVGGFGGFNGDHPRICGEHHLVDPCPEYCQGSSPHMRGTCV